MIKVKNNCDNSQNYKSNTINDLQLTIRIGKGCWCLGFDGATGKSYLRTLFESEMASKNGKKEYLGLTYDSLKDSEDYIKSIKNFSGKYILLDRFDLYFDERIVEEALKNDRCVMIDLKNYVRWNRIPYRGAMIKFDKKQLEVCEL